MAKQRCYMYFVLYLSTLQSKRARNTQTIVPHFCQVLQVCQASVVPVVLFMHYSMWSCMSLLNASQQAGDPHVLISCRWFVSVPQDTET